jgi:uncharacterized membrane protein
MLYMYSHLSVTCGVLISNAFYGFVVMDLRVGINYGRDVVGCS